MLFFFIGFIISFILYKFNLNIRNFIFYFLSNILSLILLINYINNDWDYYVNDYLINFLYFEFVKWVLTLFIFDKFDLLYRIIYLFI